MTHVALARLAEALTLPSPPPMLPEPAAVARLMPLLNALLFPGGTPVLPLLTEAHSLLRQQIALAMPARAEEADGLTLRFLEQLPDIRALLLTDLDAAYEGDPAATCREEVRLCYPGFEAIVTHRLAHGLHGLSVPLLPRMMAEHAHRRTGIDIHPGARIGPAFFIDHGTGVVIGETARIGQHVRLYQGVTLGALSTRGGQRLRGQQRHPTIGDRVTIYAGASVLGGQTVIGDGAVIGGGAFVTASVAPGMRVPAKEIQPCHPAENAVQ